jgi:hypothetical protein
MSTYKANKASAVASKYMTTIAIRNGQRIGPLQLIYSIYMPMAKRVVYNPRTDIYEYNDNGAVQCRRAYRRGKIET